jgi:peroxiredoxin
MESMPFRGTHPPRLEETPPDFVLRSVDGHEVRLAELYPFGPLVLIFFRDAASVTCVRQLREFKKRLAALSEAGATLIGIACDQLVHIRDLVERERLPFRVLIDEGGDVLARWGLRDATGTTRTATFVVDKAGAVRFRAVERDEVRTSAEQVLEFLVSHGGEGQAQS